MDAHTSGTVTAPDGIRLAYRIYPAPYSHADTLPVICLPGLTRNSRDFHDIASIIANDTVKPRKVVCLDYRGRAKSDRASDPATYNVLTEAQDTLHVLDALQISRAIFIGTSRGGLILHVIAQLSLSLIDSVVLNDVGPVLGIEGLRQIQTYLSQAETAPLTDWQTAETRLAQTHGASFPALTQTDWQDWARAIYIQQSGHIIPDCDPAIALAFAGLDLSQPLPDLWEQFEMLSEKPMLVIRGEHSQLLTEKTLSAMAQKHQKLSTLTAAGQGHAPLLHKQQVSEPLVQFLRRI